MLKVKQYYNFIIANMINFNWYIIKIVSTKNLGESDFSPIIMDLY